MMTPESFAASPIGREMATRYGWTADTWRTVAVWLNDMETKLLGVKSTHRRAKIIREAKVDLAQRFGATWEVLRAETREWDDIQANQPTDADKGPTERKWFTDLLYSAYTMRDSREPAPAAEVMP